MPIQQRNIALCIVLSIVTCGIYGLYWIYTLTEDSNMASGEAGTSGGMVILLSIITCGIYEWYWLYKLGEKINIAKAKSGLPSDSNAGIIYIVLAVFGLGIVAYALAQSELNKVATM